MAIPPIGFIGSAPLASLISICVIYIKNNKLLIDRDVFNYFKSFFLFYLFVIGYVTFRVVFSEEISYLLSILKSFAIFISCLLYLSAFGIKNIDIKIINVFALNAIICLIAGSIPSLLNIVYFFKSGDIEVGFIPYRNAFLSGSGYFGISSVYAVIIAFCTFKILSSRLNFQFFIKFLLIVLAGVLSGRTAFVGLFIGLLYLMVKKTSYAVLATIMLLPLVYFLLEFDLFSTYSNWIFEFVDINNGGVSLSSTSSTDALQTMYFYPSEYSTWFWGDGRYVDGQAYYMKTDAGYMRNLFFGGIIFSLSIIFFSFFVAYKSRNAFFLLFLFPLCLALHYKGVFILNNPTGLPVLLIISYWFFKIKECKR
ncbi:MULTISPECIES: hypothetical protein [Vibrio]|uniref:hypothetical protein n=1 Tax=Vibrio TaxID=662 RepID=UPI001E3DC9CE|nr:hypothetical protein [Vibrio cholerae]MCD6703719.1 hypothetical protein [Vibrio cholerae]